MFLNHRNILILWVQSLVDNSNGPYFITEKVIDLYYELDRAQHIKVDIFSISGQHIKSLQKERQGSGNYSLPINLERQCVMIPLVYRISIIEHSYSKTFLLLRI